MKLLNILGRREWVLVLWLAVAVVSVQVEAQEAAPGAGRFNERTFCCYFADNSLWLAQLGEQPADNDSPPDEEHVRGYKRRRAYDKAGDHLNRLMAGRRFNKHIEQFRILKLLELLDLREDQELEFIRLFHAIRRDRRQLHVQKAQTVEKLADGLRAQTLSDNEIKRLVEDISRLSQQENKAMTRFLAEAGRVLTPSQLGRLVVFQERFEFELLEAVRTFRERREGWDRSPLPSEPGPPPSEDQGDF